MLVWIGVLERKARRRDASRTSGTPLVPAKRNLQSPQRPIGTIVSIFRMYYILVLQLLYNLFSLTQSGMLQAIQNERWEKTTATS